jgi:hypothetical protein
MNMRKDEQYKKYLPQQLEVPCEGMISTYEYDLFDLHQQPTNHQLNKKLKT